VSPEQARGQVLDGRTDLYALGVTMYRAATGELPFRSSDWYELARLHVGTEADHQVGETSRQVGVVTHRAGD